MNDHDRTRATALLDAATAHLDPDIERLVAGGVARGRTLRRRRRVGTTLAAGAVVGVVGVVASVGPWGASPGSGDRAVDPPVLSQPSAPEPPVQDRAVGFDKEKGAAVLADLLPAGKVTGLDAWGSDDPGSLFRGGGLTYEGGRVTLVLTQPLLSGDDARPQSRCTATPAQSCSALEDGSWLGVRDSSPPDVLGVESLTVTLFTTDGYDIEVSAANDDGQPGAEPVSPTPVLTEDQLREIVLDPVWLDDPQ